MSLFLRTVLRRSESALRRGYRTDREKKLPPVKFDSQKGVLEFINTAEAGAGAGASRNGRSWRTSELRLKSFDDLHRLWFLLMKERNVLLTEKEWCRSNSRHWVNGQSNLYKVKRSMARIKGVVGERMRALEAKKAREAAALEAAQAAEAQRGLSDVLQNDAPGTTAGVETRTSPSS